MLDPQANTRVLPRAIGLPRATAMVIGIIIGASIFVQPSVISGEMPTIGGSLPFATFSDTLALPSIGLAVVNFDNNQHAVNENLRVGHLWEAIDIFAAVITMGR